MKGEYKVESNLSQVARLVSDPTRAAMVTTLLDGRYHPATELASAGGIKPQTASFHLVKMLESQMIIVERHGRHRYYRLASPKIAEVLESFLSIAPPVKINSFRQSGENNALREARTCYDHIAGKLGIQLIESMLNNKILVEGEKEFEVTPLGHGFFRDFGIDMDDVRSKRRAFARKCLDWSERKHHLAGSLGNAVFERFMELNWIDRMPKTRAIRVTEEGSKGIEKLFPIK